MVFDVEIIKQDISWEQACIFRNRINCKIQKKM